MQFDFCNIFAIILFVLVLIAILIRSKWGTCKIKKNLKDQVVIITGGNAGIGYETALELAFCNATIVLGGRDEKKNLQKISIIKEATKNNNIFYIKLDLSSLKSVQKFSEQFHQQFQRLDILINNAGMTGASNTITEDGYQETIQCNHIGPFLLTNLLLDILIKTPQSRVIMVSSLAHTWVKSLKEFNIDNLNQMDIQPFINYAKSKLGNILFAKELQSRVSQKKIDLKAVSLHPGTVRTEIFQKSMSYTIFLQILYRIYLVILFPIYMVYFKSAKQGAQTTIYCALEDYQQLQQGGYYEDCKLIQSSKLSNDEKLAEQLWEKSRIFVNKYLTVNYIK